MSARLQEALHENTQLHADPFSRRLGSRSLSLRSCFSICPTYSRTRWCDHRPRVRGPWWRRRLCEVANSKSLLLVTPARDAWFVALILAFQISATSAGARNRFVAP